MKVVPVSAGLWGLGILLMGLTAWGVVLRPAEAVCGSVAAVERAARTNASLWPTACQVPFSPQTRTALEIKPFSPLDFKGRVQGSFTGSRCKTVVNWRWRRSGEAIPPLSRLAQRDVRVAAFTLAPQSTALRLKLELEHAK